jgi:hypothetical protein
VISAFTRPRAVLTHSTADIKMAGYKSRDTLKPSNSKANSTLAKSKRDAKFAESAPVNKNREDIRGTPSLTSSDSDMPLRLESGSSAEPSPEKTLPVAQPKSRRIVLPTVGGMNKILLTKADDSEPRRTISNPGVAVLRINPTLVEKYGDANEARRLWWEQTNAFAHRWGDSDEREQNMDWVTQHYLKTHWKTRKTLAEKEVMDLDGDEDADVEKEVPAARRERRV